MRTRDCLFAVAAPPNLRTRFSTWLISPLVNFAEYRHVGPAVVNGIMQFRVAQFLHMGALISRRQLFAQRHLSATVVSWQSTHLVVKIVAPDVAASFAINEQLATNTQSKIHVHEIGGAFTRF
jgi:hypothetical protein